MPDTHKARLLAQQGCGLRLLKSGALCRRMLQTLHVLGAHLPLAYSRLASPTFSVTSLGSCLVRLP